jgi:hypothetical protein
VEEKLRELLQAVQHRGGQADMWEAGQALGLRRDQTEALATEAMGENLLEMVSLSGKVRLTEEGAKAAVGGQAPEAGMTGFLQQAAALGEAGLPPEAAQDLAADLKCLQAQLGRSRPLPEVVGACLDSVARALESSPRESAQSLAREARRLAG